MFLQSEMVTIRFFACFLIIFFVNYYHVQAVTIPCPKVDAKPYNITELQEILTGKAFYTKRFLGKSRVPYPSRKELSYVMYNVLDNHVMISRSVTEMKGLQYNPKCLSSMMYNIEVDDQKAIFRLIPHYKGTQICLEKEEKIAHLVPVRKGTFTAYHMDSEFFTFALVDVGNHSSYLIFQTCDRKYAWVQVAEKIIGNRPFITPGAITLFEDKISQALNTLGVQYERVHLVKEDKLPYLYQMKDVIL